MNQPRISLRLQHQEIPSTRNSFPKTELSFPQSAAVADFAVVVVAVVVVVVVASTSSVLGSTLLR